MSRYEQAYYDEWFPAPRSGTLIACCDCSLVHLVKTKVKNGRVYLQYGEAARSTAALRRTAKKKK